MTQQYHTIGSLQLNTTNNGKPVVELYASDTRLKYPVLRLFDLSALEAVGIDPNALGAERVHHRFLAHYRESEKTNGQGNPYKDVTHLEPIEPVATATPAPDLVTELRRLRRLVEAIAAQLDVDPSPAGPAPIVCPTCHMHPCECELPFEEIRAERRKASEAKPAGVLPSDRPLPVAVLTYNNGEPVSDNEHELAAFQLYLDATQEIPDSVDDLRKWIREQQ